MKDNSLHNDDKISYEYEIRSNLINLHIEQKKTLIENMDKLNNRVKDNLQDQFRKLRNHFDNDYATARA